MTTQEFINDCKYYREQVFLTCSEEEKQYKDDIIPLVVILHSLRKENKLSKQEFNNLLLNIFFPSC